MIERIKAIYRYLTEEIWTKAEREYHSKFMRWLSGHIKVFIYTIRSYGQNQMTVRCAGLTYYTLMAIVPLAAVVFGVAKAVGFDMQGYVLGALPRYRQLIEQVIGFAENITAITQGGLVASVGLLVLLWSVIKVFMNTEESFNFIWEVRKQRNITRRIADYISILILGPIVIMLFSMARNLVESSLEGMIGGTFLSPLLIVVRAVIPFISAILIFTLVYFVMPNTKVQFMSALKSGTVVGVVFVFVQLFYAYGQSSISNYNIVYGGLALLPLFLIWLNVCWQIVMFGAELSFGYQNVKNYQYEREAEHVSYDYRRKVMLLVMHRIATDFAAGGQQMDSDQLAEALNLPVRIVRDSLFELEEAGLIISAEDDDKKTTRYYPAHEVSGLRVYDVIRAVETRGLSRLNMKEYAEYRSVSRVLLKLNRVLAESDQNVLLSEIKIEREKA
ncbi:MAG: YihY family inner membrane protein [Rikenellaceae bacterium]|nr:YihY family inner membrane protein [Rikenellaceae bacterium]